MKRIKKISLVASLLIAALVVVSVIPYSNALALPACGDSNTQICTANTNLLGGILKNVINVMLYLAGAIAVIMVVVGGIRYITSDGDPGAASKAKNTIIYALVGIVVASMSYAIVNFVIDRISI